MQSTGTAHNLCGRNERQHRPNERCIGLRVASRVVVRLGDLEDLNHPVDDKHRTALA